jgi:hypothetical protein
VSAPAWPPHPGQVLGALSGEARLRVFAVLVTGGPMTGDEVAGAAGLDGRVATGALERLEAAGLVRVDDKGRHVTRPEVFAASAGLASRLRPETDPLDLGASAEQATVLRGFFRDGKLVTIPSHRGKRRVVMDFLAQQFEPGQVYREPEVNRTLKRFHPDFAALRRFLVDEEFLERREGYYWRAGGTFDV